MASNPYAQYARPNPYAVFATPGTGPKPPSGYGAPGTPAIAPLAGGPEDPVVAARKAGAEAGARASATVPIETAAQMRAAAARIALELDADKKKALLNDALKDADKKSPGLTAESRDKAIAGFVAAQQLDGFIRTIEDRYKSGPGATSGIGGLKDYLPTTANQRFNVAGDAVRGSVGNALNFTGGQLNTPTEAEHAIGPFLPQAGDRDEVILDKIAQLKSLRDRAGQRAVAQLGGAPDANGVITPVRGGATPWLSTSPSPGGGPPAAGGTAPPSSGPTGPAAPIISLATGATRTESDPQGSKVIDAMIRSGATDDQIDAALTAIGSGAVNRGQTAQARAYLAKNPAYKGSFGAASKTVGQSVLNRMAASPAGTYAINAADAIAAGTLDNMTADPAAARAGIKASNDVNPNAALLGSLSGGALAAAGTEIGAGALGVRLGGVSSRLLSNPLAADFAYGSAYGAGSNDEDRLTGATIGAAGGALGGMFGRRLAAGAGRVLRGVTNPDVALLRSQGVPLTVGQIAGGAVKGVEDRLAGVPVIGDIIRARRLEGFNGFNQAAFDQGLGPINASTNGMIGEAGIDLARVARSRAYDDALDHVSLNVDPQFANGVAGAQAGAGRLPGDMAGRGAYAIDRAGENVDPSGQLTGRGFQQALRRFRRTASENAPLPNGHDLGDVMRDAEGAYTGLVSRQAPDVLPALGNANAANRNVEVLRGAVNRARNGTRVGETGVFAPSQLADEAAANARRFGNTAGTTDQPFFDLTRAGQAILPSSVPDSGTPGRLALLALPAALGGATGTGYAVGGAEGAENGAGSTLGLGTLLALGGTRRGQQILTRTLLDRPDVLVRLGDSIANRRQLGGMFGAGIGASLPALSQ